MACGDRFAFLVQADGYGPENPTGNKPWASDADVELWQATADTIFGLVRARWNALIKAENTAEVWKGSDAIRASVTEYETGYAALEDTGWWVIAGADKALAAVVANAQQGACVLELVVDALEATDAPPMPVPSKPKPDKPDISDITDIASGGLGIIAAVVGAFLVVMLARGSSPKGRRS